MLPQKSSPPPNTDVQLGSRERSGSEPTKIQHMADDGRGFTNMADRRETIVLENASDELLLSELKRQLPHLGLCIESLLNDIKESEFTTHKDLTSFLKGSVKPWYAISIPVAAGLDNLIAYATRTWAVDCVIMRPSPLPRCVYMSDEDLDSFKPSLLTRVREFALMTTWAPHAVAIIGEKFINKCPRRTILVHGYSTVVLEVLKNAMNNMPIKVFCTIGSPSRNGLKFREKLEEYGIPAQTLDDTAVAYRMPAIDMVLLGANGVDESGGIISQIGTLQIAIVATNAGVPVYVAVETFKFGARVPTKVNDGGTPEYDYTEEKYIDKIISDSGILSPSAIESELKDIYFGRFPL